MEKFDTGNFATHTEELEFLVQLGFGTNKEIIGADSIEEVWQKSEEFCTQANSLSYHIDGMVVKLNDNRLASNLGVVGKTPRAWCAVKFAPQEVTTQLTGITWQVGRTGKITPVAELKPVLLAGTTVKRATLHNYKEFVEKDLIINDTVVIRKAGEIIPEIVQVLSNLRPQDTKNLKFEAPTQCPVCHTNLALSTTGVDLVCPNDLHCEAQILGRLSYFTQRNIGNIVGLSEKQIEKFVEAFGVQDIPDLFKLPYEKIAVMEGFGNKSAQNIQTSVQKAQNIQDYKFLAGLCIEGIGLEVAKLITNEIAKKQAQAKLATVDGNEELFS